MSRQAAQRRARRAEPRRPAELRVRLLAGADPATEREALERLADILAPLISDAKE